MKRTKFTKIILGTCALVILVAAVIVFGFLNFRMGKSNKANRYYALKIKAENSTIPQNPERICSREGDLFASCMSCITQNYLFVMGSVNLIDLSQKQIRLILNFVPCGDLVGDFNSTNKMGRFFPIRAPVTMMFDHRRITFTPGEVMTSQNLTVSLGTGDVIQYPFDYFETNNILVSGTYFEPETNSTIKLPIEIGMEAALLSYRVSVPMMKQYGADLKNVALRVAVSRSLTTRFFSLIVNVIMWALSLLSLTLSTTLWLRDRKVEPPTLGLSISLLFALPTLRNSQPNIPAIGCLVDIVTLFWTVALAALSTSLLYLNYIIKYTKDKKPSTTKPKAQSPNPFKEGQVSEAELSAIMARQSNLTLKKDDDDSDDDSDDSDDEHSKDTDLETGESIQLMTLPINSESYSLHEVSLEDGPLAKPFIAKNPNLAHLSHRKSVPHSDSLSSIYNSYGTNVPHPSLASTSMHTRDGEVSPVSPDSSINDGTISSIYGAYRQGKEGMDNR